jgi:hypothetical protein
MGDFILTSPAFSDGEAIPPRYTCEGANLSPPLSWSGLPEGTRSLALIMDDPDAPVGTFTHWLAWGIDPEVGGLAAGERAPVEGRNDFGVTGYGGPCPPPGHGPRRSGFTPGRSGRSLSARLRGTCLAKPCSSASTSDSHPCWRIGRLVGALLARAGSRTLAVTVL